MSDLQVVELQEQLDKAKEARNRAEAERNSLRKELVARIKEIDDLTTEVLELRNALHQEIYS